MEPKVNFEVVREWIRMRESSPLASPASRKLTGNLIVPGKSVLKTVESLPVCMSTRNG